MYAYYTQDQLGLLFICACRVMLQLVKASFKALLSEADS